MSYGYEFRAGGYVVTCDGRWVAGPMSVEDARVLARRLSGGAR